MDSWVWHQVGLELSDIDVEGTIESERGSEGRHNLSDQSVQVGICGAFDVQVTATDIVDGFVIDLVLVDLQIQYHERAVGVLEGGMGGQNGVVRFNNCSGDLRSRVH